MIATKGYAAFDAKKPLAPFEFTRRDPGPKDVLMDVHYCGVCHSDIHSARNEWGGAKYPMVPGHEIVGKVTAVGAQVSKFKVGDLVGVGCMVDSCRTCHPCKEDLEQYCERGATFTYNSYEKDGRSVTYGGYSNKLVVDEAFVLRVSEKLDLARVAPLLCAGITTYSPLKHWKVGPGQKVAVVGLGGLGHMGVKFANAMGAHVTVFSTSASKREDAMRLGAHEFVISKNDSEMKKAFASQDFILNTVSAPDDLNRYVQCLKLNGTMVLVGLPDKDPSLQAGNLIFKRRRIAGSLIGGIAETQEMLDFCAEKNVMSDIELIPLASVNTAYERMLRSDVKYRFVLDLKSLT